MVLEVAPLATVGATPMTFEFGAIFFRKGANRAALALFLDQ